jgi:hypothetical protein
MTERDPIARDTNGDGRIDKIEYPDGRIYQDTDYDGVTDTVYYTGENNPYRVPPEPGIQGEENHTGGRLPLPDTGIPPVPDSKHQAEERARAEEDLGPQTSPSSTPEDLAKQQAEERARAEEDLVEESAPAPGIQGEDENLAKGRLPLPDPVEEPAPAPGIQGVENFGKGHLPGLVEEEPPVEQSPSPEPPVQPTPPPPDHGLQENYAKDYGFPGLDVEPPTSLEANLLDPIPSSGPSPFGPPSAPPSGEGEYEEQDVTPLQFGNTGNFNNTAPSGEGEYEEQDVTPLQFGNTANLENSLDPNLLDPIAPGPTLDMGLVERITQSPGLVDRVNQDPSVAEALERDPTQLDQIEQDLGVADHQRPMEPSGDSGPSFTEPSLTEQPPPESSTPDDGADDLTL